MSRCSRAVTTSSAAGSGRGSVRMPTRAIWRRIMEHGRLLSGLEVLPAVRQVERLVDQREVGNDVADHRVLEHRPVLTTRDRGRWQRRMRGRARPLVRARPERRRASLRPSRLRGDRAGAPSIATRYIARRLRIEQRRRDRSDQPHRFEQLRRSARQRAPRRRRRRRRRSCTPSASYGAHGESQRTSSRDAAGARGEPEQAELAPRARDSRGRSRMKRSCSPACSS